jgi:hypothetical protein
MPPVAFRYSAAVATGIRFFQSGAGARIAYSAVGSGPPLILVTPWVSHLELSEELSGFGPFHDRLAEQHTVIRYDRWGSGLSDRDRDDFSIAADVAVLLDLADHLRLRRFALFGPRMVDRSPSHSLSMLPGECRIWSSTAREPVPCSTMRPGQRCVI